MAAITLISDTGVPYKDVETSTVLPDGTIVGQSSSSSWHNSIAIPRSWCEGTRRISGQRRTSRDPGSAFKDRPGELLIKPSSQEPTTDGYTAFVWTTT